jgi:hypothetical protein
VTLLNLYRSAILRARIAFHEVALHQIKPLHEDVPHIVLTLCELTDKLVELKATK